MFLLLIKEGLSSPPYQNSANRDAQKLPGRVKASSNYLRKVSFLSLLHQSALHRPHTLPRL